MLKVIFLSLFTFVVLSATAQVQTQVIGDSVFIHGNTGTSELILQNSTNTVNGFLFNKGTGRTEFRRALIPLGNNKYLIGADTLDLSGISSSGAWLITGNAGTASSNFIGTTDNVPLQFKVNGTLAGRIGLSVNDNVSFGILSLPSSTTGISNTAIGKSALGANTTGSGNTANGFDALWKNTSGSNNTAIGWASSGDNTTGGSNTSVGLYSLFLNSKGGANTAIGEHSMYNTVNDSLTGYNSALGFYSLFSNTTGTYNIGLGYKSGNPNTTLSNTFFISDSTSHGYWKLDSASGTAPNVIGKDASGFWHVYQTPSGSGGSGWSITGNSGTTPGTNFVGTTDNKELQFKVNNVLAGRLGIGAFSSTSYGQSTVPATSSGIHNNAFGYLALSALTSGGQNTALGDETMAFQKIGNFNVAVGTAALGTDTAACCNTAIGWSSMTVSPFSARQWGYGNTAIGYRSLYNMFNDSLSIALGYNAGIATTATHTLFISDSTTHLYMKLDSVTGTAPNAIGKDASGFWHVYQTPSGGSGWNITGNSGTVGGTNFIGTTDNVPINFRVNNALVGTIGTTANYNVSFGALSLPNTSTGIKNGAIGGGALGKNTTGANNFAIGYTTLFNNLTGSNNTGNGWGVLGFDSSGTGNTAMGAAAMGQTGGTIHIGGSYNSAFGYNALIDNFNNKYNIGLGYMAGSASSSSNTLYVSDSTSHMYYKLDSASGTAPNLIGKDPGGFWHVYQAPAGGGSVTANNGLTVNTGSNVQLGGALTGNTTIAANTHTLTVSDATPSSFGVGVLNVNTTGSGGGTSILATNDSNGYGVYSTSNTGTAITGQSTSGNGVQGLSSNAGVGVNAASGTGLAITGNSQGTGGIEELTAFYNSAINTVLPILNLKRLSLSSGNAGIGGSIDFYTITSTGATTNISNQIISKWTTATNASRTSQFLVTGVNSAVKDTLLTLSGNGAANLGKYGVGAFPGTPAYSLQVDASGNVIEGALGGGGSGVTSVSTGYGLTGGPITTTGTVTVDSAALHLKFLGLKDSTIYYPYASNPKGYLTSIGTIDTTNISNFSVKVRSLFSATTPITYVNGLIGITQAGTSGNGYLSSTDWNTFNNKLSANQSITFAPTGDVTGSITGTTTIAPVLAIGTNKVLNSMLAQMPTLTIKGNNTGSTANASDLTVAQVNTILPVFNSALNGLVPFSGGSAGKVLHADGVWRDTTAIPTAGVTSIQEDGSALTSRPTLNFNYGVTATDNSGSSRTDVNVNLTTGESFLASDVTMTTAATFYDGGSVSLTAGTWMVMSSGTIESPGNTAMRVTGKIWDGTTVYAASEGSVSGMGGSTKGYVNIGMSSIITLASTTTIRTSYTSTVASCNLMAAPADNGTGTTGKTSSIRAIRIK